MAIRIPQKSGVYEECKQLDERVRQYLKKKEKVKEECRSSNEYICWIRDLLKDNESVNNYEFKYRKDKDEKTNKKFDNLSYLYLIIGDYYEKYSIQPTDIIKCSYPIYRIIYEDFCFEILCLESPFNEYVTVRKSKCKKNAINYRDIIEDKEPQNQKERQKFIEKFQEQIKENRKKAEELCVDIEKLKLIAENELEIEFKI